MSIYLRLGLAYAAGYHNLAYAAGYHNLAYAAGDDNLAYADWDFHHSLLGSAV